MPVRIGPRALLRKPDFFFGDSIEEDEAALYDGDYKWLRQIGNRRFFLPNMERMYPLAYLQYMSACQTMDRELAKSISGVILSKIDACEAFTVGHGRDVLGLQSGLVGAKYSTGETPQLAASFIRQSCM